MAAVQRKLVHKQFNSPMGLYSQENVKATLNRELKAFGADGIEIDDQITKPLNLANSAVLRAVEEEEQQIKCAGEFFLRARQSRTRHRATDGLNPSEPPHHALHQQLLDQIKTQYLSHQNDIVIDRDTVLRINRMSTRRHLLKRDHSWPPVEQDATTVHSGVTPSPTHSIDVLREKFNSPTRIVELSPRDVRQQRPRTPGNMELQDNPLSHQSPQAKGFSAPETKAADTDLGLVAPKCEYYEQLMQQRPATPTLKSATPYRPRLKRQSYSLDRGRARKRGMAMGGATELPPPKPRSGNLNKGGNGNEGGNGNRGGNGNEGGIRSGMGKGGAGGASGATVSPKGTPKVQRRSIKLATELKICYDGDSEEEPKVSPRPNTTGDIDLETLPLPATPSVKKAATAASKSAILPKKESAIIDSLALKQQQQMALALATIHSDAQQPQQPQQPQQQPSEHIIPVSVIVTVQPGQLQASVQQIYDDACSYLQQDQQQQQQQLATMTPPNRTDDATPQATYVSATSGIKLQRQESVSKNKSIPSSIPTPPPLPPPTLLLRAKSRETVKDAQDTRRQGGIYGCSQQDQQHEAHVEIAQLEAKYAHIQQSIAEHLRQIDSYMENAKTALQRTVQVTPIEPAKPTPPVTPVCNASGQIEPWDMFASRQSPILAVESPLQAILRQIYCRAAGIQVLSKEQEATAPVEQPMPAENVPIVERALEDLHKIAVALDSEEHALLHVEHQTKPMAAQAQHVVIEEEEQQQEEEEATKSHVSVVEEEEEEDLSLDYRHVSDVIANYEQLSTSATNRQDMPLSADKTRATNQEELRQEGKEEMEIKATELIKECEKKEQELKQELKKKQEQELKQRKEHEQKLEQEQKQEQEEKQKRKEKWKRELAKHLEEKQKIKQSLEEDQVTATPAAADTGAPGSPGCAHESIPTADNLSGRCNICGECRDSPHGWGKINKADQWRFDNLHNESLANYKSTYEVRSPYISRQISWEDTQQQQQPQSKDSKQPLQRQRSEVEIVTTPAALAPTDPKDWQLSRSPSPLPLRKYPAPLIETAQRCSSPFGLNAVQPRSSGNATPTAPPLEAKYTHVPQLEGHNIGLLVRTATEPLQLSMSASSSLLAATPPSTPRCNSQPPPFEFLMQHGLGARTQADSTVSSSHLDLGGFKSLAGSEDLPQTNRDFSINRSFDNVSPRPYIGIEGYKRVAWPPASEERIVREFTPQPQTQSPAPGAGGYYPQQTTAGAAAPQPTSAATPQGPIYNNVQSRNQHQQQTQPQQQQQPQPQHHHQQPAQNAYGAATNYASNGYAPATVAAAAGNQIPANNYNYPQQPIQYKQAQFNRQPSREPAPVPATAANQNSNYPQQQHQQQQQQQQQYQPSYQQQPQQPAHDVDNVGGRWKHIRAPLPKTHNDFTAATTAYAPYQQQQQQYPQQQQQYQQQQYQQQPQQQYRAPSVDNYQQQQQQPQQPAPQHWQQQQQQQPQQQLPQQQLPQQQQQYQAPYQTSPYQQQQQQPQQHPSYPQQNGGANYAQPQYNSYSQPQQQQQQLPYSQDQTDQQHSYRGASPGMITLRRDTPVSQKPAPVYTSQPAAVSYQGGSKLRGDMKWPPQEYKEAAVKENEERRLLALGPVCRPRRVNRDYTTFFAKHQLNNAYPSYKVPPGTQHMFA